MTFRSRADHIIRERAQQCEHDIAPERGKRVTRSDILPQSPVVVIDKSLEMNSPQILA